MENIQGCNEAHRYCDDHDQVLGLLPDVEEAQYRGEGRHTYSGPFHEVVHDSAFEVFGSGFSVSSGGKIDTG
jgi:hypothetical protein